MAQTRTNVIATSTTAQAIAGTGESAFVQNNGANNVFVKFGAFNVIAGINDVFIKAGTGQNVAVPSGAGYVSVYSPSGGTSTLEIRRGGSDIVAAATPTPWFLTPYESTVVLCGHSYSTYNSDQDIYFGSPTVAGGGGSTWSRGNFERTNMLLGCPFRVLSNLGTNGATSTQCLSQIPQILSINPGYVWLSMIVNDPFNSIPPTTSIANCITMINALTAAGITVIFVGDYPRSGMAAPYTSQYAQVQNYVRDYCIKAPGVIYLDGYASFADYTTLANAYNAVPDTTKMLNESGYVHPNSLGAGLVAYNYAKQLAWYVQRVMPSPFMGSDGATVGDLQFINNNPILAGTGGTFGAGSSGTLPTNWYSQRGAGSITGTCSVVSRATAASVFGTIGSFAFGNIFDDGKAGNVIKISLASSAAAADNVVLTCATPNTVASGSGAYRSTLEYGINPTSGTVGRFDSDVRDSSFVHHNQTNWICDAADYLGISTKQTGVMASRSFYAKSYTPSVWTFEINVGTSAAGTADIYIANAGIKLLQV